MTITSLSCVWVLSELYFPEETSTGHLLTKLAEGIARFQPVNVLCAQPTYASRGVLAPVREVRNGVSIERCWGTTFSKDLLLRRIINLITISLSIFFKLLFRIRRNDRVLVVTNPPLLPFLVAMACRLRGAKCLLLIHDVYPEVLVATGMAKAGSAFIRVLAWLNRLLYRNVYRVIVLGQDMERLVLRKLDGQTEKVSIIPNWADHEDVMPASKTQNQLLAELGLLDKFVVQYAGNMGRTHSLETLLESALRLRTKTGIHFLFIGSGAKKAWLEQAVHEHSLKNITILSNRPRSDQANFLNACDLAIISFMPGMAGISVPSRMYNILAAGKPILAVTDEDSELANVVRENDVGWVVLPGDVGHVVEVIQQAANDARQLAYMGRRARMAAASKYSFSKILASYLSLLESSDRVPKKPQRVAA